MANPIDILLDKTNVLEIAPNGTVVGNLSTTDPDVGETFTYELLDNAGGRFALSNGNQIVVANNSLLNYQNAIFHTIKVRTTDSTGLSYEENINIGLIDAKRNLVGYWKLDESTGSSFDNASFVNNNNDGTTQGSLNIGREGLLGGSVGFGNGQVNVGTNLLSYSAGAASFTVAAWIKPTNFNDNQSIFGVDNADGRSNGWNLGLSGNQLYLYVPQVSWNNQGVYNLNNVLIRANIPPDLLPNQWFHVALTFQGNTRTIYINGVKIASENWVQQTGIVPGGYGGFPVKINTPLPSADTTRNYLVGAENSNGGAAFKGDIDEVRLYNKPLSQSEILGVMDETNLAPKNLRLSNSSLLASSITDGTIIGDFSVQDSLLDVNKHIYTLINDAGGLVTISNNRLILNNARLLDYANNPNPTIKVRATDPDKNIVEQEFKLQLIPEEGDPLNKSLVLYYKLDEASNNNYKQAVINSAANKPTNAGLFAQYFEDRDLTKNILTRIDASTNFYWSSGTPPQRGLVSDFGTRWTGQITAPTTGDYTFYLRADDGARLWINGQQLIDSWDVRNFDQELTATISLEAGRAYDFRMEYYDDGWAGRTTLLWSGAGVSKQLVPASAFSIPAAIQNAGLLGEYFNDRNLTNKVLTRTDLGVNYIWEDWMSPDPGVINKDYFSARWTGQLIAPVTGEYTFYIKVDDGARLWVNGQQLINAWRLGSTQEYSGKITLEAGKFYDFKLEYYEQTGYGSVQVAWEAPGITKQIIPGNVFTNQKLGLAGEYFSDINLGTKILERSDSNVDFDWEGGTPDPNLNWKEATDDPNQPGTDDFSARWTGKFKAPVSGEYTFWLNTKSDDGVRLWVNNQPLVNAWERGDGIDEYSAKITLEAGKAYDFKLEYYNPDAEAGVQVSWEAPGLAKQIIPSQVFFQQTETYSNQASGYYTGTVNPVTKIISQGPTRGQDGIYGSSVKFSQGNYIDLKINDRDLQYDQQFTIMAWVKPENFNGLQEILAPSNYEAGLGFGLDSKGIRLQSFRGNDPSTWINLPTSTLANQWMHLAVSHNNGTVKFYLNGTELGTRNLDANFYPDWANGDYNYLIGGLNKDRIANEGLNDGFKGNIDEVRFYNQALTGAQITGIIEKYNSGPSDITIASNVITADTADGTVIGKLDTVGIPIDKGKYTYQLLDDAGGKFAINGDQIVVKNKSLLSYLDRATETIKIKSTNQRNQSTEKVITIQLIQSEPEGNLKAYYKLDETSNLTIKQTAIDSSGNNKHGLYNAGIIQDVQTTGATRGEQGIDGTSASFSNWQDYINIGNQSITYGDQFTVSTWIRPSKLSGMQMILSANDSGNGAGFGFGLIDKKLAIIDWQSDRIYSVDLPATITPDQWIQVGATYVGQTVTLYLNGLAVGSQSFPITSTNRNYLIGAGRTNANDPNAYNGQIDEVRFYDRALSADELKKLGNQPPSALELDNTSLIEFNQRYPNTFERSIGNLSTTDANTEAHTYELIENPNGIFKIENNQLMVAQPELVDYETAQSYDVVIRTTDAAGNSLDKKFTINIIDTPDINKVAVFDGVNDYIGVNSASPILEGNQFTLEAWVFSQASDGNRGIINFGENQGPRVSVVNQTDLVYGFGNSVKTATGVLATNEWHQIAVSFNGQTLKLYVDGQLKDSTDDFAGQTLGAGQQLTIGKGEQFFQGKLDDIRIWKVSRTEQEIQYNQYQTLSGTEPHLVAFYSFDEKDATETNGVVDSTGSGNSGILFNGTLVQIDSLPPDPTDPSAAEELTTMELPLLGKLPLDFVPDFLPKFENILNNLFENSDLNFSDGYSFAEYVKNLLPEGATIEKVVQTPGTPEKDEYKVSYSETKTLTSVALSGNLGLPGFGIKTNGSANVDLVGKLDFTVGYNDVWGAYIDGGEGPRYSPDGDLVNPYGATAVTINLSPRLSEDFSATGTLGFFQLDLKNDPNNPTGLNALYRLGLEDPNILRPGETETGDENDPDGDGSNIKLWEYRRSKGRKEILDSRFQFEPHIGLDAKTSFNGNPVLPSFNFKLGVNWEPTIYTGGKLTTGSLLPTSVAFNQVNLGLGTFVSDVIRPIVTQVNTVITPFRPIIKFATDDIPIFEQLGLKSLFDYNQDNRVTVLDLTNVFKVKILGQDPIDDRFFKVLNAINKVSLNLEQMANTPADQELAVNLGSYVFDDINTKISNPFKNKKPEKTEEAESQEDGLNKGNNSSYLSKAKNLFNSIKEVEGLGFPILTDPFQAMYLLTGQDNADLITFDLPELEFTFDVAKEFSIWGPLYGRLGGGFSAKANLGFGYDTYGLTKWKNNNFSLDTAFQDTLDGFYVNAPPAPFNQLQLRAYVEAGFGIDVVIAAGYLIGGIEGKAGLRLVDKPDGGGSVDDKLRPSEILSRPFIDNFNLNGSVSFYLDAYARLGLSTAPLFEWRRNLLTSKLFEFSVGGGASGFTSNKYISGATVFLDSNFNWLPDEGEPNTISGLDASYQLNYSLATYDKNNNGVIDPKEGQLVSVGGTDIYTQLPVHIVLTAPGRYEMITPVTTLVNVLELNGFTSQEAEANVLFGLGLNPTINLATFNAQKEIENGNAAGKAVMAAHVKLHNVMEQITQTLKGVSTFSTGAISQVVSKSIADELVSELYKGKTLELMDAAVIERILNNSVTALIELEALETQLRFGPTAIALSNRSVAESSANDLVVGTLSATDPEETDTFTYSLINDAGGRFGVINNQIVVANGSLLDYETTTSHTIRVKTTDAKGLSYEQDFIITVTDVEESSTTAIAPFNVVENVNTSPNVGDVPIDEPLNNIAPLAVTNESSKWDLIKNFSQQMAQIIGDGSKEVEVLLLTTPLDQLLDKMSELQGVLISSTAQDLQKLAKGEKTLEEVVAANNSDGIAQKITALNDLSTFGVVGTDGNDELTSVAEKPLVVGKDGNDTLNGLNTADQMFGEGGNDTLISNGGIDFLNGGDGNDTYVLAANSGGTTIADNSGNDTISGFTPVLEHMAAGKMGLGRSGASLFIDLNQNGEIDILQDITILNYFADAPTEGAGVGFIETVGSLAGNDILELLKNHAPTVQQNPVAQQLTPYQSFNITLSRNIFKESDPNDYVVYKVTQADGSALPDWVSFDAGSMTLSGQATAEDVGQYQFKVVGTDQGKLTVEVPLSVTVQNPVYGGTPNKDTLTGSDSDDVIDGGLEADTLIGKKGNDAYSVDNTNDRVTEQPDEGIDTVYSVVNYRLPDNVENLVLTGTGPLRGIGNAANNWITGGTGNNFLQGGLGQDTQEGGAGADKFYFASPDDGQDIILDFDPTEGDRIQISTGGFGSNQLKDFSFSNGVLSFKGKAIATLQKDGQAHTSFTDLSQVLDLPTNNAPIVKQTLPSLTVDEDAPQKIIALENLFEDGDGDTIVKTIVANSNSQLVTASIVNQQLMLNFQPNQFGTAQITVQGSDNLDSTTSSFTIVVKAVNDTPIVNQPLSNLKGDEGKAFRFVIPRDTFSDVEDSQLSYALSPDSQLPEGIIFDPVTGTFSGTPSGTAMGNYQLTIIATDKNSAQISTSLTLTIANTIAQDVSDTTIQFTQGKSGSAQGNLTYDLQKYRGDVTTKANDNALKQTDALFHNLVGLYEVQNNQGAILDTFDSNGNGLTTDLLNPNDVGYAKTAIANAVHNFVLQMGASGDTKKNTTASQFGDVLLQGGKLYAPFVIANGGKLVPVGGTTQEGFNAFVAKNPTNTGATAANFLAHEVAYFSFGSANPDGVEHLQNRSNNVFGFEDLPGNLGVSDFDFNDAVFQFSFIA